MPRTDPTPRLKTSSAPGIVAGAAALLSGWYLAQRVAVPSRVKPVQDFDLDKYLGHWYEIARIDFRFERGLTSCTADYSLNPDGSVRVLNRGFDPTRGVWKSATAVARFNGKPGQGALKVSFFRPFYAGYNVVHIGQDYDCAVVVGDAPKYSWILSRTPEMDDRRYSKLLAIAAANGAHTSQMHRVPHGASE